MKQSPTRRSCLSALTLCLVAACAAPTEAVTTEEVRHEPAVLEGPLGELVTDLIYGTAEERLGAADELGSLGSEAAPATEHLALALSDEEPGVRILAAEALSSAGGDLEFTLGTLNDCLPCQDWYEGAGWFRRTFAAAASWRGRKTQLWPSRGDWRAASAHHPAHVGDCGRGDTHRRGRHWA